MLVADQGHVEFNECSIFGCSIDRLGRRTAQPCASLGIIKWNCLSYLDNQQIEVPSAQGE